MITRKLIMLTAGWLFTRAGVRVVPASLIETLQPILTAHVSEIGGLVLTVGGITWGARKHLHLWRRGDGCKQSPVKHEHEVRARG